MLLQVTVVDSVANMAAQPPPLVVPSYYQLVVPGSNLPTAGIPGDTDEAGNILGADTVSAQVPGC